MKIPLFIFELDAKVKIIPLAVCGRIISIWITSKNIKYEVRYFDKAEAREVYFFPDELERVK